MGIRHRIFIRDDRETEVDVDYLVEGGSPASGLFGPPEDYDPGSGPEITISDSWIESVDDGGQAVTTTIVLTEAERDRFETEVLEDPELWEPDEPDFD